jgi:hypothetical protein
MSVQKPLSIDADLNENLNKRTKHEWIEGAVALKYERFEVAGALFDSFYS